MKINRHNYEEYFILYADKELSSDECRMVEEFVALNPDLKDELEVYLSTVLLPEISVGFENKEELMRYDESLISYIDDELTADERMDLEKLIVHSPKLQQELGLYQKTKLHPDTTIVFENKSVLYRSTERRKVVTMTVLRWSVAAAVLLAIAISAITIINKKADGPGIAKTPDNIITSPNNSPANNSSVEVNPVGGKEDEQVVVDEKNQDHIAELPKKTKPVLTHVKEQQAPEKKNENAIAQNVQPKTNNLPQPDNNPNYTTNPSLKQNDAIADLSPIGKEKNVNEQSEADRTVTNLKADPYIYAGGATTTIDPDEEGGKNKKSRGLFRKLTRVFEKNTGIKATDDEDKLHIAAFTVKLK